MKTVRIALASDIHYAGPLEQARGNDYEYREIPSALTKLLLRYHRHYVWMRHPLEKGFLLDRFLSLAEAADYVVLNGDYSCDSAFVGVSDEAALESARVCIDAVRGRFGSRTAFTYGDHELGKVSLAGNRGGMRLASFHRAQEELGLPPFWRVDLGAYSLIGIVSSLVGLPVFAGDALPNEMPEWERLRREHLATIRKAFASLGSDRKVLLFCHDPTALPFLWQEEAIQSRIGQVEQTFIGHLHSPLILWQSRILSGMPVIKRLGPTVQRLTSALNQARYWRPFKVKLCPATAGIELLKDGGFLWLELEEQAGRPIQVSCQRMPR